MAEGGFSGTSTSLLFAIFLPSGERVESEGGPRFLLELGGGLGCLLGLDAGCGGCAGGAAGPGDSTGV